MESRTMDTVQKHIYSNYHSPSSEPYRVYITLPQLELRKMGSNSYNYGNFITEALYFFSVILKYI
jgi:hypothetical protein